MDRPLFLAVGDRLMHTCGFLRQVPIRHVVAVETVVIVIPITELRNVLSWII